MNMELWLNLLIVFSYICGGMAWFFAERIIWTIQGYKLIKIKNMKKYFCDVCKKEISGIERALLLLIDTFYFDNEVILCKRCLERLKSVVNKEKRLIKKEARK